MRRRGFTIIELLVVIVVLSVIGAMLVPSFESGLDRARFKGDLIRITSMMSLASSMAAAEARPYRLVFDAESGEFWLTVEADPVERPQEFVPVKLSDFTHCQLDETIKLSRYRLDERTEEQDLDEMPPFIEFRPDGTADRSVLVIASKSGDTYSIILAPMTSSIRIKEGDVLAEEELL